MNPVVRKRIHCNVASTQGYQNPPCFLLFWEKSDPLTETFQNFALIWFMCTLIHMFLASLTKWGSEQNDASSYTRQKTAAN